MRGASGVTAECVGTALTAWGRLAEKAALALGWVLAGTRARTEDEPRVSGLLAAAPGCGRKRRRALPEALGGPPVCGPQPGAGRGAQAPCGAGARDGG